MRLLRRFREHPATVRESYLRHCVHACSFGWAMLGGAFACFVHALLPWIHTNTGSEVISRLHERMVVNRVKRHMENVQAGQNNMLRPRVGERR
jgi:hypothetical protein